MKLDTEIYEIGQKYMILGKEVFEIGQRSINDIGQRIIYDIRQINTVLFPHTCHIMKYIIYM